MVHNFWCLLIKWDFFILNLVLVFYLLIILDNVLGYSAESGSEGTSEGSDANSQSVSVMPLNSIICRFLIFI